MFLDGGREEPFSEFQSLYSNLSKYVERNLEEVDYREEHREKLKDLSTRYTALSYLEELPGIRPSGDPRSLYAAMDRMVEDPKGSIERLEDFLEEQRLHVKMGCSLVYRIL